MVRSFGPRPRRRSGFPSAEMDFAQVRIVRQAGAGTKGIGGGDGAGEVGGDDRGVSAGGRRGARGLRCRTGRRAGLSSRSSLSRGSGRGGQARSGSWQLALQDHRQARDHGNDQGSFGGEALVQASLLVAKPSGQRISGNDLQPVSLETMTMGLGSGEGCNQPGAFGGKFMVGEEVIGEPERCTVDQDRLAWLGGGERAGQVQRGLDRGPIPGAVALMLGDAVAHLVVPGFGGGDVAAGAARCGDQAFSKGRFAGPGAADDESEGRK